MQETEELISLIFTLSRLMREMAVRSCKFTPQSAIKTRILALSQKSPTMKELADSLYVTPPSITATINQMVKNGELRRVADQHDRRIIIITITDRGKRIFESQRSKLAADMENLLKLLNHKEKTELIKIIKKIINQK